jgi:hypothetical protein
MVRFNFPLFLTWLRIVAIPVFVAVLYMPESWITERTANVTSMWIFIAAAVTDWADGYLARKVEPDDIVRRVPRPGRRQAHGGRRVIVLTEKGIVDPFASAHHHRPRDHHLGAARMDGADRTVEERRREHSREGEDGLAAGRHPVPSLQWRSLRSLPHGPVGRALIWLAAASHCGR